MSNYEYSRRRFLATASGIAVTAAARTHTIFAGDVAPVLPNKRLPKILLYSGWNTKNIGDQGHTPGTMRFLEEHLADAELNGMACIHQRRNHGDAKASFPKCCIREWSN